MRKITFIGVVKRYRCVQGSGKAKYKMFRWTYDNTTLSKMFLANHGDCMVDVCNSTTGKFQLFEESFSPLHEVKYVSIEENEKKKSLILEPNICILYNDHTKYNKNYKSVKFINYIIPCKYFHLNSFNQNN